MNQPAGISRSAPSDLMWGDFGGQCLAGMCSVSTDLFLPRATAMGLPKAGSFLLGTWQTEHGHQYRVLRGIDPHKTSPIFSIFSAEKGHPHARVPEAEKQAYQGGLAVKVSARAARIAPPGKPGMLVEASDDGVDWHEAGIMEVTGRLVPSPTQWFNPWRSGGAFAVTAKYRSTGTILGKPVDGFFAYESHFFPAGGNFMDSPFGFGGREVHWGHMATAFEDGTVVDASLAIGLDGWGFALLTDETGQHFATTDLEVLADVRPNGYPERILYRFLGQEWEWVITPEGERPDVMPGVGPLGAEGIFRRVGEARKVVAAMGTIDWWRDGREKTVPAISG